MGKMTNKKVSDGVKYIRMKAELETLQAKQKKMQEKILRESKSPKRFGIATFTGTHSKGTLIMSNRYSWLSNIVPPIVLVPLWFVFDGFTIDSTKYWPLEIGVFLLHFWLLRILVEDRLQNRI